MVLFVLDLVLFVLDGKNVKLFVVWALNSVRFVIDRVNGREKIFLHFLDFFEGILQLFISNLEKLKRKYTGQFFLKV